MLVGNWKKLPIFALTLINLHALERPSNSHFFLHQDSNSVKFSLHVSAYILFLLKSLFIPHSPPHHAVQSYPRFCFSLWTGISFLFNTGACSKGLLLILLALIIGIWNIKIMATRTPYSYILHLTEHIEIIVLLPVTEILVLPGDRVLVYHYGQ